jgi:hypothetical protein
MILYHKPRRGIILYLECQAFSPVVRTGPPPPLLPQTSVSFPLGTGGGGQHSQGGEGVWGAFGRLERKPGTLFVYSVINPLWVGDFSTLIKNAKAFRFSYDFKVSSAESLICFLFFSAQLKKSLLFWYFFFNIRKNTDF